MLRENKLSDAFMVIASTIACSILFFGIVYSDSKSYIHMTRFLLGMSDIKGVEGCLAVRPLIPLLAAPLAAFLWMPVAYGILNSMFWVLSAILMYDVTFRITNSRRQALAAALLFTTSPPTLLYFGSVMLEAGGTFFSLLILWMYLRLQDKLNKLSSLLAGVLAGVGVLSRETTLPVAASILLLGIAARRVKWTLIWTLVLMAPSMMWQGYTTLTYGKNYWTHYVGSGLEYCMRRYGVGFYTDVVDIVKALALAHFPLATICLIVGFLSLDDRRQNLIFYSLLLPALGAYLLWPFRDLRIGVVAYYATMPLAGVGLDYVVRFLKQKPLISRVEPKAIWVILYLIHVVVSMIYVYTRLGTFSPPWNIHLFAPSSLRAGL